MSDWIRSLEMAQHEKFRVPLVSEVGFQILRGHDSDIDRIDDYAFKAYYPVVTSNVPKMITAYGQPLIPMCLLTSEDGKELVIVGRNGIAASTSKYKGFHDFLMRIKLVLDEFCKKSSLDSVASISLTYINLVPKYYSDNQFSGLITRLEFPRLEAGNHFLTRAQGYFEFSEPPGMLKINFASFDNDGAELALEFTIIKPNFQVIEDVDKWVSKAHDRIYDAFISMLNPKLLMELR